MNWVAPAPLQAAIPLGFEQTQTYAGRMFTIEHDFDATVITLVDEGAPPVEGVRATPLQEDVTINAFEDCVTLTQFDPRVEEAVTITLSMAQVQDLAAALNLPEGVYRLKRIRKP
jgi:hypothetical protein